MENNTKISIQKDGNQWCVLWGEDLQNGIAGFGDTINDAMKDLAKAIIKEKKKQIINCNDCLLESSCEYSGLGITECKHFRRGTL